MPISAVPCRVMLQLTTPAALATPLADQLIVDPLIVPSAVPVSFRSLAQVALNEPRAEEPVCSVTFHLKSVQVLGVGMRLDEVQLPSRLPEPAAVGAVAELPRSKPKQAEADAATATQITSCASFF